MWDWPDYVLIVTSTTAGVEANSDAWPLRKYGIRLMPELHKHLNPMPFEKALNTLEKLTEDLRAEGCTVTNRVSAIKERYLAVKATLARECRRSSNYKAQPA